MKSVKEKKKIDLFKSKLFYFKIGIIMLGLYFMFKLATNLINNLPLLIELYNVSNVSIELRFLMICLSLWINLAILGVLTNFVVKIYDRLK